jgi:hypothetical protein
MESSFAVAPTQPSFSVGGVVGRTFSTWSRNLVPFALLAAIVNAPSFVFGLWSTYATYGDYPSFQRMMTVAGPLAQRPGGPFAPWSPLSLAVWLGTAVLMFVQMGALTYGAIQHLAGREVSLGALLGAGFRRAWPVFVAGFASGLLTLLGTLLLIVPGIILFCALAAAIPAVVAEAKGPMEAVRRSFALTKGRRFGVFVAFLVMGVVAWTATALAGVLPIALGGGTASLAGAFVAFAVGAVAAPLWTLLPAVAYHDLRVEKEGVDTAALAKVFE